MHRLDPDAIGVTDAMAYQPSTAQECALREVELIRDAWSGFLESYTEPLITYGVDWLRRFAPVPWPRSRSCRAHRTGQLHVRR
jgi:hypothetical protein